MTRTQLQRNRPAERGYSLVEVMIAAGVMAGVLLSISTMFIAGTQSVRSGRDLTRATTLANSAMEQVMTMPYDAVYGLVGGVMTDQTLVWTTDDPIPTMTGSVNDVAVWTEALDTWRMEVQEQLQAGLLSIRIDGVGQLPTESDDGLDPYVDATYLRITVTVSWRESRGRQREVVFEGLVT